MTAQDPQEQSDPHLHGEQVQFGLPHAPASPQLQCGPQVHGEQAQFGLSQVLFWSVMLDAFHFAGFDNRLGDEHNEQAHTEGGVEHRKGGGDHADDDDGTARGG